MLRVGSRLIRWGSEMKPEVMLELLQGAAEQLNIKVSYEPLQLAYSATGSYMRGGLCRLKGANGMEWRGIVDKRASDDEGVAALALALGQFHTSEVALPHKGRELIALHPGTRPPAAARTPP